MSGPYDYPMNVPSIESYESNYPMYEQQYGSYQRVSAPPMSHEGFAFWYRPGPQDNVYRRDSQIFDHTMAMQTNPHTMTEASSTKHRRTRSGCFTCRSRRVKCDETRPICDRCRKGNRECEFPQSSSSTKKTKSGEPKSATSETAPDNRLDTIADESEEDDYEEDEDSTSTTSRSTRIQNKRPTPARVRTQSLSSTTKTQRSRQQSVASSVQTDATESSERESASLSTARISSQNLSIRWRKLKPDLKTEMEMYLRYQHEHMTFYHYLFKVDPEDFVHKELIDLALTFEPLLYAVVAFAAYHHTVRLPESQASFGSFWKYYCKSIVKLRKFLESTDERHDAVLLTVLQLATFEEYLGDWTNLATHHRAAYGILTTKHTPKSIMDSDRGRKMYDWYVRLDVISGLMAIRDVSLDQSWNDYATQWHADRCEENSNDLIPRRLEYFSKIVESVGREMAHIFAKANEMIEIQQFSITDVLQEAQKLTDRLDNLRVQIQKMNDDKLSAVDNTLEQEQDDVFSIETPLYREELWPLNFVWLDWYSLIIILNNQKLLATQKALQILGGDPSMDSTQHQLIADLTRYSKEQCQIYNALIRSPDAPPGIGLVCYAALGLSSVFLPKAPPEANGVYTRWARKQLANIERQGYVWPPHFRREMAQIWQDPTIEDWWLPNEEGKLRILSEIRMVVEDRIAATTNSGRDDGRNDLREIKGLFEKMDMNTAHRRGSMFLDPSFVNSTAGMTQAASLVSTPEDGSSAGSVGGFSPRTSITDIEKGKVGSRSRKASRSSAPESPLVHTKSRDDSRMSDIWEDSKS